MMEAVMTLDMLLPGQSGRIIKVNGEGAIRLRLLDMGLTPKTAVLVHKAAPMGDPIELHLRGYSLSIRLEEARNIEVNMEESGA
jgi:Fe2+ transport system protein FeoA